MERMSASEPDGRLRPTGNLGASTSDSRLPGVCLAVGLSILMVLPWVLAAQGPPSGRTFSGAFFYQDDYFQYLSFVEQAARGAFPFQNKFALTPHEPFLVNLSWGSAGLLAMALGRGPAVGFLALNILAVGLFVFGVQRFLDLAGLTGSRRTWGVILVSTGGGMGWLRTWQGAPMGQVVDMTYSFYPWLQILTGPHGLMGTALLLWAIALHLEWRAGAISKWPWVLVASVLGLCRPFDLAVFSLLAVALAGLDRVAVATRRPSVGRPLEVLWLTPVLFYDTLAFAFHPAFAVWSGGQNAVPLPPWSELAWALGPAGALAGLSLRSLGRFPGLRAVLLTWSLALVALLLVPRLTFAAQFATSLGAALLLLVAAGTKGRWLPLVTVSLSGTSLVLLWRVLHPLPMWFPPQDYLTASRFLEKACRPGDVVYAPVDPSLMVAGLTPCRVVLGHRVLTPHIEERAQESHRFFAPPTAPSWRRDYLERMDARFAMIPSGKGSWLAGTPFVPRLSLTLLEVWERESEGPSRTRPR